jgi:hypothetical protein
MSVAFTTYARTSLCSPLTHDWHRPTQRRTHTNTRYKTMSRNTDDKTRRQTRSTCRSAPLLKSAPCWLIASGMAVGIHCSRACACWIKRILHSFSNLPLSEQSNQHHCTANHYPMNGIWEIMTKCKVTLCFTLSSPAVTKHTNRFNIKKLYVLPTQCICVFCVDLRTNSDYFTVHH